MIDTLRLNTDLYLFRYKTPNPNLREGNKSQ